MQETLRPLKTMDCMKALTKKAVNDKYIELLQIGWFTSNTTIHFRLDNYFKWDGLSQIHGHDLSVDAILDGPNFSYNLDGQL